MPPSDSEDKRRTPRAVGRRPRRRHTRIDRFERLVAEVVDSLPEQFLPYLEKVAIVIENWPDEEDLADLGLGPDETLFGLHRGPPLGAYDNMLTPPMIVIYRGPILEECDTDEDVRREVRTTVLHEVGHFFGLSEDDLTRLGLD
ncbi:MAG: metallopeptidase family protein [Anaerolineae bacterium]